MDLIETSNEMLTQIMTKQVIVKATDLNSYNFPKRFFDKYANDREVEYQFIADFVFKVNKSDIELYSEILQENSRYFISSI